MPLYLTIGGVALASLLSLFFSSITYSLREYSRAGFAEYLGRRDADRWFDAITEHTPDLIFITAVFRQFANILVWVLVFASFEQTSYSAVFRYAMTIVVAGVIAVFLAVTIPHAAARYAAAELVGFFAPVLHVLRLVFSPLTKLMHGTDDFVRRALGASEDETEAQIDNEILSAVEEGEKEGFVDEQEREIIESVIEFRDTTAGHIMTPRQDIAALPIHATLEQVKNCIEQSRHSRIPVYEQNLDHIAGILHARDLIKLLGQANPQFSIGPIMRPAIYVPETKPLSNLLSDFRHQKVQVAVVLDEYGSTAGIVTLEDVLEELVGEISDEHENDEPAMLKKIDERTIDADARIRIEDVNRLVGLNLPEDAGYETLAGFLSTSLARIPDAGTVYEHDKVRYTVLDAEPQRINRVKIEFLSQPATEHAGHR
ncbi:MAG TPA: hemolysin family protein [Tepidisphaeraceae bacterium]|jgi:CBS domain containing-hemolysin-like protein|nr:hemolysin family protein [Tepidisphaeraceae bacterium]